MKTNRMITLIFFMLLSGITIAQIAPVSSLQSASGFLETCGSPDTALSAAQAAAVKNALPSELPQKLYQEMDNRVAEVATFFAYLAGLIEGWKEGHEHGVIAAQFPDGWPADEKKALAALPLKQFNAATAAMTVDVPCIPDYVTIGQERDIVVKFIRKNMLLTMGMTRRVVWLAFQEAFPCPAHPAQPPQIPDAVK
jgi:hypothetical protein